MNTSLSAVHLEAQELFTYVYDSKRVALNEIDVYVVCETNHIKRTTQLVRNMKYTKKSDKK